MNKKFFTHALAMLIGGGIGYLITKKLLNEKYADMAQEEIDDVRDFYERKYETKSEPLTATDVTEDEYDTDYKVEDKSPRIKVQNLYRDGYTVTEIADELHMTDGEVQDYMEPIVKSPLVRAEKHQPGTKVSYHQMAKENMREQLELPKDSIEHNNVFKQAGPRKEIEPSDETEDPDETQGYTERDLSEIDRTQPYEITSDEYNDEFVEHDKVSIYYYMLDDVLCDEHEEVMDDIAGTVGYDVFKTLEDHPTAWARNERLAIDYEICVVRSSYAEVVQGVPARAMSPREQYQNRQRRRPNDDEQRL